MNCQEFENEIQKLLDQRVDPDSSPLIQAHAAVCADCRDRLGLYVDVMDSVRCRLPQLPPEPVRSRTVLPAGSSGWLATLAAAIVVVFVIWVFSINSAIPVDRAADADRRGARADMILRHDHVVAEASSVTAGVEQVHPRARSGSGEFSLPDDSRADPVSGEGSQSGSGTVFGLDRITPVVHQLPQTLPRSLLSYYRYTSGIPGVKPVASGINNAARLIQDSINRAENQKPPEDNIDKTLPQSGSSIAMGVLPV